MEEKSQYSEIIKNAKKYGSISIGVLACIRTLERNTAQMVFLGNDIDDNAIIDNISILAKQKGTPIFLDLSCTELGQSAGIAVGASSVSITNFGISPIYQSFDITSLVKTKLVNSVIPYIYRVETVLRFREKFIQYITDGEKQGTLRLGYRIPSNNVLPIVSMPDDCICGYVKILEVQWLKFHEVANRDDILHCEWPHEYETILYEMKAVYDRFTEDSQITYYRFAYIGEKP